MATLSSSRRASLPNSAFAYIDSKGERRLPIHDESHVRNALSRFNQVRFESEEARERAFRRLLKAATGYGIAPVGFVSRELRRAQAGTATELPAGPVTLLLTDIEGSTGLVQRMGDAYPPFLEEVRQVIRDHIAEHGGYEVDARADEFFAAFGTATDAVGAAIGIQTGMAARQWPGSHEVRVRIGIHSGSPALTDTGYVGLPVHVMARVCTAGHGGQIVITSATRDDLGKGGPSTKRLGAFRLQGLSEPTELFQVEAPGLATDFPTLRVGDPV
jgi:class 3 adenylate cyclase